MVTATTVVTAAIVETVVIAEVETAVKEAEIAVQITAHKVQHQLPTPDTKAHYRLLHTTIFTRRNKPCL